MQLHTAHRTSRWFLSLLMLLAFALTNGTVQLAAAQADDATNSLRKEGLPLSAKQARLADRYDRLELLAGRLAELSRSTQPRRAQLLRELVAKSRERDVAGRFEMIIVALQKDSLSKATKAQGELQTDLQKLLNLLLQEDRDQQIESERKRIKKYLDQVKRLIQLQRGIKARTDGGDDAEQLKKNQQKLSEETEKLADDIQTTEGSKSSEDSQEKSPSGTPKPGQQGKEKKNPASEKSDADSKSDEPRPDEKDSSDQKSDEKKEGDQKSGEQKPGENKPNENKPSEESKSNPGSQPSKEGQPSPDGKPSDSRPPPGQGKSSPSSPSEDSSSPPEQAQSPAQRAEQRLKQAKQRMQQALEKLEDAKRDKAVDRQEQALRELEQAKAELERILRQLREEEMERMLVLLEARFRKMLDAQIEVYEQTKKLATSLASAPEHEIEIAAGRLDRKERAIIREADRALILLREDGTTVAFPEAIEQAREDMQAVAKRLGEVKIGMLTQGIEEDIIAALEETLAALQQAIKKARDEKSQPQQKQQQGEPGDEPLVDKIAELRMIRALQNRINRRTKRYGEILGDEPALEADLLEALEQLSERQQRVYRALQDLDSGRNQ